MGAAAPSDDARDLMTGICDAVDELSAEGPGDILVFLSGEREIRDADDALRTHLGDRLDPRHPRHTEILPLFARLSAAEQHRVFEPHPGRRVVLATNVAETSLTVPGVRYVVDPGTARISRWSKATKVQRLPIEPISQASASQRSGRCGRVADGVAIRLYSEADLASRPEFTEPEILRTSLASVILQMIAVGVAASPEDVATFPFVDPPDTRAVRDGVQLLVELGALARTTGAADGALHLTDVGRALALLPIDPRLARMIVEAGRRGVAREVMIIAAALSIQDPRERPAEVREQADESHRRFADPTSDLLAYLNLWHHVRDAAARAVRQRVPPDVPRRAPELPAPARVAGRRHPAQAAGQAPGHHRPARAHPVRRRCGRGRCGRRVPAGVGRRGDPSQRAVGAALADRAAGGHRGRARRGPAPRLTGTAGAARGRATSTSAPAGRGSRSSPARRSPRSHRPG